MPRRIKLKPLMIVSAVIILSDFLFILINYYASLNAIQEDTRRWTKEVQHVFSLSLDNKETSMQQLAAFVANMPKVKKLFYEAETIYRESHNANKDRDLASIRKELYEYVRPSWVSMTSQYDVRQLHFHFGPGSTSFLRVHKPKRFGDNMDQVRFTIVDVNKFHKPVKGFETGRVYSGIRGVVPVEHTNKAGETVYVGALEAGTSLTGMLQALSDEQDCEIAVLLGDEHVRANMWPEFIASHFGQEMIIGSYFMEGVTSPDSHKFLSQTLVGSLLEAQVGSKFITGDQVWQVGAFPLRDYRGTIDPSLPNSGVVVVWRDAAELWQILRNTLWINIGYSLLALIIVETALIVGWRLSQRHLDAIIERQTHELKEMATHDGLTDILNRKAIEQNLTEEADRSIRHGSPFSIIMFDIDYFKKVNDSYGHNAGDEVLKRVSACVANLIRTTDKVGRWGGEEFLVLVPETPLEEAMILAERIRKAVEATRYAIAAPVTVSLGVAQFEANESGEGFVKRADTALYQAKEGGRNRAVYADCAK